MSASRASAPAALFTTVVACAALAAASTASRFTANSSASETISTASLAAPTGLSASCVSLSTKVTLTWTATSSHAASGYQILRSTTNGGPYSVVGSVSGSGTTTYTDTIGALATEYWVVQATRDAWTSPNSNQAGLTSVALGICNQA